jgi:hypothetical protein
MILLQRREQWRMKRSNMEDLGGYDATLHQGYDEIFLPTMISLVGKKGERQTRYHSFRLPKNYET